MFENKHSDIMKAIVAFEFILRLNSFMTAGPGDKIRNDHFKSYCHVAKSSFGFSLFPLPSIV